jgi:CheY-like chemotaxis protein
MSIPQRRHLSVRSARILILDDDADCRNVFTLWLRDSYDVLAFDNARDALSALIALNGVDLIVTDINMPEMDGREFLRAVRERPAISSIPVIAVTGVSLDPKSLLFAGFTRCLLKPVDLNVLTDVIAHTISH